MFGTPRADGVVNDANFTPVCNGVTGPFSVRVDDEFSDLTTLFGSLLNLDCGVP